MTTRGGLARVSRAVTHRVRSMKMFNSVATNEARIDRAGGHDLAANPLDHVNAAVDWLVRAQDATNDGGVSRGYNAAWDPYFGPRGWQASYPETTGYIIPTFFDLGEKLGRPDLRARAIRMADWEIEVQLDSGAVQGGTIGEQDPPRPAVFNTGQVILGWLRAHEETSCEDYLEAARRAGGYLCGMQDDDGDFRAGQSAFARAEYRTYNTRVGWALCQLGKYCGEPEYLRAGIRSIEFGMSQQLPNGWFKNNCLDDPAHPLLHTISYATRGILEAGMLLGREYFVESALKTARALAERQRANGRLAGRFADDWTDAADWDCLTGDAQLGIIWWKLGAHTGQEDLQERARRVCAFLMRSQNRSTTDLGIRGGIKGSFPFDGEYGRYQTLNWATKFFLDVMVLAVDLPAQPGSLKVPNTEQ